MSNFITITSKKIKNKGEFENISHEMKRSEKYMNSKPRTNIHTSKSHLNETLLENKYQNYEEFLDMKKQEIKEGNLKNKTKHRMIREDSATQYNFTIQATNEALSFEEHQLFLKECANALSEHFKENEIIESHIHNDETTPHLHFCLSFFNKEKQKFNQKELLEEEKTKIDTIFKKLEPIYTKYGLQKYLSMEQKIEALSEKDNEKLNEILKDLKTEKEHKQAKKRFLKSIEKYGGEAYTLPSVIKNENHTITKKLNEDILKDIENIKKINNIELEKRMKLIKTFDIDIEKFFVFFEKEQYYKIKKSNLDNLMNFHKIMIESYKEINEYNTLMTILKTKLENVKDIKDLEQLEKETQNIKQNLEILEPYYKELQEKIKKGEEELKQFQKLTSEVQRLETQKNSLKSEVFDIVASKNTLESELLSINKKIVSQSQTQLKLQNELETLERVNPLVKEFSRKLQEEEKEKQKNIEKFQEEQRQRQYRQQQEEQQHRDRSEFRVSIR